MGSPWLRFARCSRVPAACLAGLGVADRGKVRQTRFGIEASWSKPIRWSIVGHLIACALVQLSPQYAVTRVRRVRMGIITIQKDQSDPGADACAAVAVSSPALRQSALFVRQSLVSLYPGSLCLCPPMNKRAK